jgi:predicted PurR-regulated permease PerM
MERSQSFNSGRVTTFLLAVIAVIMFCAVLKVTSSVVLPFTVSLLLAIVTIPLVKFLSKFRIPRVVSVLLIFLLFIGSLFFMGMILYSSGRAIIALYPKYEERLTEIYIWAARLFELPYDEHLSIIENLWGQLGIRTHARNLTLSFSNNFLSFLMSAFLVAIFITFLLLEAAFFREKLDRAFKGPRVVQIKTIISDIMVQVAHYLSIKFFLSVFNGILIGTCLKIVGLEFAMIWGVFQFVANFIPSIGSIAVGVAVTTFSIIQFWPNAGPIIAVGFIMLFVNIIIGFIVEPKIMGDRLGLSPLVVLISLLVWGWIWGFTGLILAVPMMAIIKIICKNIPVLEPISILLGSHKAAGPVQKKMVPKKTGGEDPVLRGQA